MRSPRPETGAHGRRLDGRPRTLRWLIRPLGDPLALLLLVTGITYTALGQREDAIIAFAVLVPVVSVALVLEARSDRALDRLRRLAAPTARVWRGNVRAQVPAAELVPGDVIDLRAGDVVPADASLQSPAAPLTIDESLLTGESVPVLRSASGDSTVYAGTSVLAGQALASVTHVGADTRAGEIGHLLAGRRRPATPLERAIRRLAFWLAAVASGCCVAVVGVELGRGVGLGVALVAGITLAMAAVPEEFPMVYTLYLSVGAWRLARDRALIRQLAGVETLGSATVICADKTGTLTLGREALVGVVLPDGTLLTSRDWTSARPVLEAALFAGEPDPVDPLERAIATAAIGVGITRGTPPEGALAYRSGFDPAWRSTTTVWTSHVPDSVVVYAKGALEVILDRCHPPVAVGAAVHAANERLAADGMRLIAVAVGCARGALAADPRSAATHATLDFLGLLAFADELRPGVIESVADCKAAGIRIMLLTGDHPTTARAVAQRLGLGRGDASVVTGQMIARADAETLATLVREHDVFARVLPDDKHRLVRALQTQGEIVAMTGDGVNDAPALRDADIGIALGAHGTDVARQAATLVLLDDNFTTIVRAVRNGRRIAENLQQAFAYLIAFHVPMLLIAFTVPLAGMPLILLPIHMVWLELVVHPTSALVFEADPGAADLMRRAPRPVTRYFLRELHPGYAGAVGAMLGIAALLVYFRLEPVDVARARTVAFATLLIGQLVLVLVARSPTAPVWRSSVRGNRLLIPIECLTLATLLVATLVPPVRRALALSALLPGDWLLALVAGIGATILLEPFKMLSARARDRGGQRPR